MTRPRDKTPADTLARFLRLCEPEPNTGCWIWLGPIKSSGYGQFSIRKKCILAHRASLQLYKRPVTGTVVMHKCHTKWCVNPEHLEYGTAKENWHASNAIGTTYRGERQHLAKITEAQVRQIKSSSVPTATLGRELGIAASIIYAIRRNKTWKHVT